MENSSCSTGRPAGKIVRQKGAALHKNTVLLLLIILAVGVTSIIWNWQRTSTQLIETMALRGAALYSASLMEFRTLYASEVVSTAKAQGLLVTHDYADREAAIPLPATLSMLLAERIGEHDSGSKASLYSPYPFPWRAKNGGLRDNFSEEAWEYLQANPDKPFVRFEAQADGMQSLRYATADRMRAGCVNCHNSHPDTPKNDWKLGDVRGVLEVVYPLGAVSNAAHAHVRQSLVLYGVMLALGLIGLTVVFKKLQRRTEEADNYAREMAESRQRFEDFVETAADWFWEMDASLRFTYISEDHVRTTGIPSEQFMQRTFTDLFAEHGNDDLETWRPLFDNLAMRLPFESFEYIHQASDGMPVVLRQSGKPIFTEDGVFSGYRGTGRDVTESHNLNQKLAYQASHDPLTDLVNRREFERRVRRVVETARAQSTENALCYLDLDQFKIVNATCGHVAGDELLRQLATLLGKQLRHRDTVGRLGGDEFGVLMEHCSMDQAENVITKLRQAIEDFRFQWEGKYFNVTVSIGMVAVTATGGDFDEVTGAADSACFAAKDLGRNRVHVYQSDDETLANRNGDMQWVARIKQALADDRFALFAQPIMALNDSGGEGPHYEVLVRLEDEHGQMVPPGAFLPAAERYNLSGNIDRRVISKSFEWLASHPVHIDALSLCAINLSGGSLTDDGLVAFVIEQLQKWMIPADKICFEITETMAIANLTKATEVINTLRNLGCKFALDDFGTGLSSFAYLKTLPVDFLKIDGTFVKDIVDDPIDFAMVKTINELGKVTGKRTIAEFVENEAIRDKLQHIGVDYAQGYGIGMPQPIENMAREETFKIPEPISAVAVA